MSDHREAMSEDKTAMSDHKTAISDDGSQMSELDKQLAQWQSAYKDATPSVDTDALINFWQLCDKKDIKK